MLWTSADSPDFGTLIRRIDNKHQNPTEAARLIHHNLVISDVEDVLFVQRPASAVMCYVGGFQVDAAMCVHFLPCIIQRNDLCPQRRCENPFYVLIEGLLQARQNRLRGNLQIFALVALMFEVLELNAKVGVRRTVLPTWRLRL